MKIARIVVLLTSLAMVAAFPSAPSAYAVTYVDFYRDANCQTWLFGLGRGDHHPYLSGTWNNSISSMRVPAYTRVDLYDGTDYWYFMQTLLNDTSYNGVCMNIQSTYNDKTSSIKTFATR